MYDLLRHIKKSVVSYRRYSAFRVPSPLETERAEWMYYIRYLKPGMTVFDVGANLGMVTQLFATFVGSSGSVHAFEPSSETFDKLSTVCEFSSLKNVKLNNIAVSDKVGSAEFHIYDADHASWNSLANRPLQDYGIDVQPDKVDVIPTTTIDVYCQEHQIDTIDLLKVDVEGAEFDVLKGANEMLRQKRVKCCLFEFGQTTFDMGHQPSEIIEYANSVGYRITNVVAGAPAFPIARDTHRAAFAMNIARPK